MPSSSDWDWYPAQIRLLVKSSSDIPRPPNSIALSSENRSVELIIPQSAARTVDMIELRVRDQSGYEMYIRATPNSALQNLDLPSSNDWDWHVAQLHFLNKELQVPSQPALAALTKSTRTPSTNVANAVERGVRNGSRHNYGSFVIPTVANRFRLPVHDISLNYLSMELELDRYLWVDFPSREDSAITRAKRHLRTTTGLRMIFEDPAGIERFHSDNKSLDVFRNVLHIIYGGWRREWYELQLENITDGDSIKFDSFLERFNYLPKNDDVIKIIFTLKPYYLELDTYVSVRLRYLTSEVVFSMVATLRLRNLFDIACELWRVSCGKVRFYLNGWRMTGEETPESIEMEDDDFIEAYLELAGGGPNRNGGREDDRSAGYIAPSIEGTSNAIIPDALEAAELLPKSYPDIKHIVTKSDDETSTDDISMFLPPASEDELLETPTTAEGKQPQNKRGITIKVKDDTENEIFLNVMPYTRFSVIMKACEKRWDKSDLRFFSPDGPRILPDDTPETLDLEDGDQISALIHTWGGR